MRTEAKLHPMGARRLRQLGCLLILAMSLLVLTQAASASADFTLCAKGSAAGQCERPEGVAVDRSTGHVYLADQKNNRIDVFGATGDFLFAFGWGVADGATNAMQTCTTTCFRGIEGTGAGQFAYVESIAVDNDPASPSFHDVYVSEGFTNHPPLNNERIQKFSPSGEFILMFGGGVNKTTGKDICTAASGDNCGAGVEGDGEGEFDRWVRVAVGPNGTIYVADSLLQGFAQGAERMIPRIQKFEPSGVFVEQIVLPGPGPLGENGDTRDFAVDTGGNFYLLDNADGTLHKYSSAGVEIEAGPFPLAVGNPNALTTDAADDLFASESTNSSGQFITEYDPAGNILRRFGYDSIGEETPFGLAASPTVPGDVYGTEFGANRVQYLAAPPPGPLPCCLEASPGNTKATLEGGVNPEGKAATYHFEYISEADFAANGNSFSGALPAASTLEGAPVGPDFDLHPAEAQIGCATPEVPPQPTCLLPGTQYRYRLVATNTDGKSEVEATFTTKPPFEIAETFATEVGLKEARLHAAVNPLGIPTSGYFEYVDDAAYQADLAQGEGHDGFAEATKVPDVDNGGVPLDFGSGNTPKPASVQIAGLVPGATYHYRVVVADPFTSEVGLEHAITTFPVLSSPSNSCPNAQFRTGPSSKLPDCRAYEMVSPVDKNGGDVGRVLGGPQTDTLARLEQSSADGNKLAYSSVTAFGDAVSAPWTSEYLATRTAGEGWSTHAISPPRESSSITQIPAFKFDVEYKRFSADLSEAWLIHDTDPPLDECAPAGVLNLYRRDNADNAYEALTISKPTDVPHSGYELELQGVSADGSSALIRANGALAPTEGPAPAKNGVPQLYEHVRGEEGCGTLRLVSVLPNGNASASALGASLGTFGLGSVPGESRGSSLTNAVSADGSRVFWTAVGTGFVSTLYVRDMVSAKTVQIATGAVLFSGATTDGATAFYTVGNDLFEVDVAKALAGEAAVALVAEGGSSGFRARIVALADDGARLYFISSQALGGEGEAGKPNLYLREGGETTLVATLLPGSASAPGGDLEAGFFARGFSVGTPSSNANGVRVSADGAHLVFVSAASPTGYDNADAVDGRPNLEVYLYDAASGQLHCISCNPTGARPAGRSFREETSASPIPGSRQISAQLPAGQNQFTSARVLSADGNHLFFESFEALLPRDTNGKDDVYEWTRASSQKECEEEGAELYVPSSGGCLSLISTGLSSTDSELADISSDGSDVFIRTASSLLPQDPGQVDIYDARIHGGLPQPPPPPAECEGETCQGAPTPPNDPTPASIGFQGAGDPGKAKTQKPRCAKGKARRKGRCVARKGRQGQKRANHNGRAGR